MLRIEHTEVVGWEAAIRGMRNPMNSWELSDSELCNGGDGFEDCHVNPACGCPRNEDFRRDIFCIGKKDYDLMKRLCKAGTDHRKFMRMIVVYCDITAPLYWWKEFDQHKVGTVSNSCSTMHKIADKDFTIDDFSREHLNENSIRTLGYVIEDLNNWRNIYIYGGSDDNYDGTMTIYPPKDKQAWWQMIQLLPSSYNQKRTIMMNYEVLANIYKSRKNHKLDEWLAFCAWIENIPYSNLITGKN